MARIFVFSELQRTRSFAEANSEYWYGSGNASGYCANKVRMVFSSEA